MLQKIPNQDPLWLKYFFLVKLLFTGNLLVITFTLLQINNNTYIVNNYVNFSKKCKKIELCTWYTSVFHLKWYEV